MLKKFEHVLLCQKSPIMKKFLTMLESGFYGSPVSRLWKSANYSCQMVVDTFAYYTYNYKLWFEYMQIM